MDKELLKRFLNHSIAKSDGQIESDYYNVYARKNDDSELFVLQNKDTCITLIELI